MLWLPQVTLKHLVGTYIFITQFVKSFPHRKTLNLPDVLSPSPDTSLASLEIVSNFGKLKRMPFIYTNSMRNSVSLEIISKFAKLKQKIDEFENNLQFRQSPISPNSIGSLASLGIISKFAKLKQKIDEFENNLQFRQFPISPNSIGSLASLGIISNFSKLIHSLRIFCEFGDKVGEFGDHLQPCLRNKRFIAFFPQ